MRGPRADLALYAGLLTAFAIVTLQVSMGPAIVGISAAGAIVSSSRSKLAISTGAPSYV